MDIKHIYSNTGWSPFASSSHVPSHVLQLRLISLIDSPVFALLSTHFLNLDYTVCSTDEFFMILIDFKRRLLIQKWFSPLAQTVVLKNATNAAPAFEKTISGDVDATLISAASFAKCRWKAIAMIKWTTTTVSLNHYNFTENWFDSILVILILKHGLLFSQMVW